MLLSLAATIFAAFSLGRVSAAIPAKIYGVNIGSCIRRETWFTQDDVDALVSNGINTVRMPVGFWIVESLVNRDTEFYPRGGILQLQRGLGQLRAAGINVILDHHALPGVQSPRNPFTGFCTTDVQFYTPDNYQRALVWTAVMTGLTHLDNNFGSVFAIQAVNEPMMYPGDTPGYGDFQKNFVQTMRVMESLLGVGTVSPIVGLSPNRTLQSSNFTTAFTAVLADSPHMNPEVRQAILDSSPILMGLSQTMGFSLPTGVPAVTPTREPLIANFMDSTWQNNIGPNPADAADGPAGYDYHLYFGFGGGPAANEEAYMYAICNMPLVQEDAARGESPLWFGEWSLTTNFDASEAFLRRWADAQKLAFSRGQGWIFWNFKMEESSESWVRQWDYFGAVRRGYMTKDPSQLNDPNVCARYYRKGASVPIVTTIQTKITDSRYIPQAFYTTMLYKSTILAASSLGRVSAAIPAKIYGVNIGSWLVLEPWMLPQEWAEMGGERCTNQCTGCIGSEFALVKSDPATADAKFQKHWYLFYAWNRETWFTQDDVDALASNGINTARIPLGYWLVESLVNRDTEFYPRGGILQLQRGLGQLKAAGINVILDHHALPGVQTTMASFAGLCTANAQFYTPYNYQRALVWTAVMTGLSHLDPNFSSVFSIEAVNEPMMDANDTPGYGDFQKNFVQTVRVMESLLGVNTVSPVVGLSPNRTLLSSNFTTAFTGILVDSPHINPEVKQAVLDSGPILMGLSQTMGFGLPTAGAPSLPSLREPLVTNFMDSTWQNNRGPNPADAADGPAGYDYHLYFSYGGGPAANEEAYLYAICNMPIVRTDAARGESPLWFGEWSLATNFDATDAFLQRWADAQKFAFSKGQGWIFWNFKMEESTEPWVRQWDYLGAVRLGYMTKDPSQFNDPNVCARYTFKG
ncbi:hypothetical protein V8D89_011828 [Ganoderma adspersum]